MARYLYRCDNPTCAREEEFTMSMSEPKSPKKCPLCYAPMFRVFTPTQDVWKDGNGNNIRSPGKQWVGGEHFNKARFYAENPSAKPRKKSG